MRYTLRPSVFLIIDALFLHHIPPPLSHSSHSSPHTLNLQNVSSPTPSTFSFVQINLYLLSRVIYGIAKLLVSKGIIPTPQTDVFPWFAAIMWGLTLWLFEYDRKCLQPSLTSSMTYIYKDSDKWDSLRNFLIHNK